MGSHKKQTQLQCAPVCGSSGTGGGGVGIASVSGAKGAFPSHPPPSQVCWGGGVILELHMAGAHIHHCHRRMSKAGTFCMHNYLNGGVCQLSHICTSTILGVESTCWLCMVLAPIQERELMLDPQFRNTPRTSATFQHSVNKLSQEMVMAIRHSISI